MRFAEPAQASVPTEAYHLAQRAMADLKAAVHAVLSGAGADGLTNAQIGRMLGIYGGHVGHEGHISRTLLAMLAGEGVAEQDEVTRRWGIRRHVDSSDADVNAT
jgi:hypothetical protein